MNAVLTLTTPDMDLDTLQTQSYALARDQFFAAESDADAAIEEVADFAAGVALWNEEGRRFFAELQRRLEVAEKIRRRAHDRLVWEMCNYVAAALKQSPDHD